MSKELERDPADLVSLLTNLRNMPCGEEYIRAANELLVGISDDGLESEEEIRRLWNEIADRDELAKLVSPTVWRPRSELHSRLQDEILALGATVAVLKSHVIHECGSDAPGPAAQVREVLELVERRLDWCWNTFEEEVDDVIAKERPKASSSREVSA